MSSDKESRINMYPLNATELVEQINSSPTPYHAASTASKILKSKGFTEIKYNDQFHTESGGYFFIRSGSLIAWRHNGGKANKFSIVGTHSDSPNFRVRPKPNIVNKLGIRIGVEVYGSPLLNSWLDRDLSLAGMVAVKSGKKSELTLCDLQKSVFKFSQLAIHLDRSINSSGLKLNPQDHMKPIWLDDTKDPELALQKSLADNLSTKPENIIGWDLMAYDTQPGKIIGSDTRGYISSARIDNLVSVFCAVHALATTKPDQDMDAIPVLLVLDHEEVGSGSSSGAESNFVSQTLERIATSIGADRESYLKTLASSFAISADGAHATHPNYPDRHDGNHSIVMNKGVAVKQNSSQRYSTNISSYTEFLDAIAVDNRSLQYYSHPNDISCGTTIGPLLAKNLGISSIDIGVPQLAMHSIRETAGCSDVIQLEQIFKLFWQN